MGLRAVTERTIGRVPGAAPGRGARFPLLLAVLILLLSASTAAGQRAVTARAVVHVPTVSQLDVEPVSTAQPPVNGARSGMLRLHVRANHRWKVMLTASSGVDAVWVRRAGAARFERIEPGTTMVVARGLSGFETVALEYRCEGASSREVLPFRPTLAAAEL
ncbi:MAG: hypothetical protein ACN0LA_11130 [Candidatus Longimicrobiales bacterium M2_2A_002]